jgi:hypothetical protein
MSEEAALSLVHSLVSRALAAYFDGSLSDNCIAVARTYHVAAHDVAALMDRPPLIGSFEELIESRRASWPRPRTIAWRVGQ